MENKINLEVESEFKEKISALNDQILSTNNIMNKTEEIINTLLKEKEDLLNTNQKLQNDLTLLEKEEGIKSIYN